MNSLTLSSLALCSMLAPASASAQQAPVGVPLRVALQQQSISLPDATRMFASPGPGLVVGTEAVFVRDTLVVIYQSVDLGFFHRPSVASWFYLTSGFGVRPWFTDWLFAEVELDVGYATHIVESSLFAWDGSGALRPVQSVLHRFVGGAALAIGARVGGVMPFIGYSLMVEAPFLPAYSPVLPHQLFRVGIRVEIQP